MVYNVQMVTYRWFDFINNIKKTQNNQTNKPTNKSISNRKWIKTWIFFPPWTQSPMRWGIVPIEHPSFAQACFLSSWLSLSHTHIHTGISISLYPILFWHGRIGSGIICNGFWDQTRVCRTVSSFAIRQRLPASRDMPTNKTLSF